MGFEMILWLFFMAVLILGLGGIVLIMRLLRLTPFFKREEHRSRVATQIVQVFSAACVVLLGVALLFIALFARSYHAFTREEPIARVQCVPVEGLDYDMILRFAPLKNGKTPPRIFRLKGDQWSMGGHIVQWHSWLHTMGFHTGYRITRIEGRHVARENESSGFEMVYDLGDSRIEKIWRWLYRHHIEIPMVQAVYRRTPYAYPEKNHGFLVMVTLSGFTVVPEP